MNRRELFKGIAIGLAVSALPKAVRAAAITPKADVCFYEVGGQTIFPVYSVHGGLCSQAVCLPFIKDVDGSLIFYNHTETMEQRFSTQTENSIDAMQQRAVVAFDHAYTLNRASSMEDLPCFEDGCEFPAAGGIIRIVPRDVTTKEHHNADRCDG